MVVDTLPEALVLACWARLVLRVGIPALGALARLYGAYAELLLGSNADPVLTAEVSDLRDARSRIIEAADAERRRIERDLHDGAQQRLVALALTLRMAEKRAAAGRSRRPPSWCARRARRRVWRSRSCATWLAASIRRS